MVAGLGLGLGLGLGRLAGLIHAYPTQGEAARKGALVYARSLASQAPLKNKATT